MLTIIEDKPKLVLGAEKWQAAPFRFLDNLQVFNDTPSWQNIVLSGNTALTLTNALANGLNYVKLFGGTEQRNLPEGHQQLEYIEFTGSQYVATGISGNATIKITAQASTIKGSSQALLSSTPIAQGGSWFGEFTTNQKWGIGSGDGLSTIDPTTKVTAEITFNSGGCSGTINNESITRSATITQGAWTIGAGVSGTTLKYPFSGKVWGGEFTQNNALVRDLVPDRYNDTLGFYDTVTDTFIPVTGEGAVAGSDATPTPDHPIDIVCNNGVLKYGNVSKNLFDEDYGELGSSFVYKPLYLGVGTYTCSYSLPHDENGTSMVYFLNGNVSGGASNRQNQVDASTPRTITTSTGYVTLAYRKGSPIGLTDKVPSDYDCMIEQGSRATTYEPYRLDVYTDGTVETIGVHGKNLYNPATMFSSKAMAISGGVVYWCYASGGKAIKVPCKPNTTYTLTYTGGNRCFIGGFTNDVPLESDSAIACDFVIFSGSVSSASPKTFTTPANCYYVCCGLANSAGGEVTDIQLELGSTATAYEPYFNGGSATAEMLLKVGDYQDVQSVLDGSVNRQLGVFVLTGKENGWFYASNQKIYYCTALIYKRDDNYKPICTHYSGDIYSKITDLTIDNTVFTSYLSNAAGVFAFRDLRYSNTNQMAAWKQYLADQYNAGTPVIAVYPLATATTESVTAQPLTIQEGTNIVEITQASIDNLGLEVSYKAGVKVTITEVQNANLSNSVTVTIGG